MRFAYPLALGVALALCLPPTPLGFFAPLVLAAALGRGGFGFGLWMGVGFWAVHLVWLPQSFAVLFNTPLGVVPFVPLVFFKALMWAAVFGLSVDRPLARLGLWVLLEYLTSLGDLAFPWGFVGYALAEAPGRALASAGGVYLLSLAVLGVGLGLLLGWRGMRSDPVVVSAHGLGLVGAVLLWVGLWVVPLPPVQADRTALLVQGNIDPRLKVGGVEDLEQTYLRLTRQGLQAHPQASVVVWPETAVFFRLPDELPVLLGTRVLVGGVGAAQGTGLQGSNQAVLWQGGQIRAAYAKNRLVPFGENYPFRAVFGPVYGFFFRAFGFGDLQSAVAGSGYAPLGIYGAFICYESVFPSVSLALVRAGAQVLQLGSNDAWFGPSFGGLQHFQMGRLRAVETGRWMLRAGNDGVTAVIDPYGRVAARIPQRREGFLAGRFAYLTRPTFYVRFGDWAVGLAGVLVLFGLRHRTGTRII